MGRKNSVNRKPDVERETDYYKLKSKAVRDLVEADESNSPEVSEEALSLAKNGFKNPRKKLIANLSAAGLGSREKILDAISRLGLSEDIRAEKLSLENWQNLSDILK